MIAIVATIHTITMYPAVSTVKEAFTVFFLALRLFTVTVHWYLNLIFLIF